MRTRGMNSQPDIGRITRPWYPGAEASTRCPAGPCAAAPRRTLEADLLEAAGPGEDRLPGQARLPWHRMSATAQRIWPVGLAALVGALTTLTWQSFASRGAPPRPATVAAQPATAPIPARPRPLLITPPPPPVSGQVAPPAPTLIPTLTPVAATPAAVALDPRAIAAKPRGQGAPAGRPRRVRPAATPALGQPIDRDAILKPSFR
jgi:hypothetical protein